MSIRYIPSSKCQRCGKLFDYNPYYSICYDCRQSGKKEVKRENKQKSRRRMVAVLSLLIFPLGILIFLINRNKNPKLAKVAGSFSSISILLFSISNRFWIFHAIYIVSLFTFPIGFILYFISRYRNPSLANICLKYSIVASIIVVINIAYKTSLL